MHKTIPGQACNSLLYQLQTFRDHQQWFWHPQLPWHSHQLCDPPQKILWPAQTNSNKGWYSWIDLFDNRWKWECEKDDNDVTPEMLQRELVNRAVVAYEVRMYTNAIKDKNLTSQIEHHNASSSLLYLAVSWLVTKWLAPRKSILSLAIKILSCSNLKDDNTTKIRMIIQLQSFYFSVRGYSFWDGY